METLQNKLKMVMQRTGMKATDIAYATGLPREIMYKWLKGTRPSDSVVYDKLETFLDGILEKISNDSTARNSPVKYSAIVERTATLKVPLKQPGKAVPQTNAIAAAGTIVVINDEPQLIVDRIDAPFIGDVDGVIEVTGDSMEPTFKNGCRVAIAKLKNSMILDWGEYYFIVDSNWQATVKRVYPGNVENSIQLVSDNEDQSRFPPLTKHWEQIEAIFKVKAGIVKY